MVELAGLIKAAAIKQVAVRHPEFPSLNRIEYVMYCTPYDRTRRSMRGGTVIFPGRMDRSPCGTGTAARLAVLHARGEIAIGETVNQFSTIDTQFEASVIRTTTLGDRPAIVPRIAGRAWIYAIHQFGVDPTDPFPLGFMLPDTWGPEVGA